MAAKSWVQKRDKHIQPQIKWLEKSFADMPAGSRMLIATPQIVQHYVNAIPKGGTGTIAQMRKDLAADFGTDYTCPVTSGIYVRMVAEAAMEELAAGKSAGEVAPFWRIIPAGSPQAAKLSFGEEFLKQQQQAEGIFR